MRNIRKFSALATAVVASAALAVAVPGPALAATNLTVKVTGAGTFNASAQTVTLEAGSVGFICSPLSSLPGSTAVISVSGHPAHGEAPLMIGTVTGLEFSNCTGPLGSVSIVAVGDAYDFNVNSVTNHAGKTDVTIGNVDLSVSMTGCTFTVTGNALAAYDNLTITADVGHKPPRPLTPAVLTISNVTGPDCTGVASNGERVKYEGLYMLLNSELGIHSTSS